MRVFSYFYRFVFRYWKNFSIGIVLFVVAGLLSNIQPFFVKWITIALQNNDVGYSLILLMQLAGLLILSNAIANIAYFISDKGMVRTSTDISGAILKHIHDLDFSYHVNKSSGKLISIMKRGDDAYFSFYDLLHRSFLDTFVSFLFMSVSFLLLRPLYAVMTLLMMVVSFLISLLLVKQNLIKRKIFTEVDDQVSSVRVDNLVNFDTVKYFAQEKYEQQRFHEMHKTWYSALQSYFFTFRFFDVILGNLATIFMIGLLCLALFDLQHGVIQLPDFLFLMSFSAALFPRMMHMLFHIREIVKKYPDLQKYLLLLDELVVVKDPEHAQQISHVRGKITFQKVSFQYNEQSLPVLVNFSLTIHPGEVIAFVGYSGAGKTTIAKLLMRMYDPTFGAITIDGLDIREMKKSYLRSLIGVVPQDPLLFNDTVHHNIAYPRPDARTVDIAEAAQKAQAHEFIAALPNSYEAVVGERGIKLSGGQRQRLAIARVLLKQPNIVIFDEATAALDSESERAIQEAFWKMVRDVEKPKTSIIIAHRLSTIMRADRIVVLHEGKIQEVGSHEQLIENEDGIYHRLWMFQKNGFIGDEE